MILCETDQSLLKTNNGARYNKKCFSLLNFHFLIKKFSVLRLLNIKQKFSFSQSLIII